MSVLAAILGEPRAVKFGGRNLQDPRLLEFFEVADTAAGVAVNEWTALRLIAVYACIRVISEDVGKLPFMPYRRVGRGKERVEGRLFTLLHDMPNPEMCSCTFRETLTSWALRTGNGYAEIIRDRAGRAVEMWPIESNRVHGKLEPGGVRYEVDGRPFDATRLFHLRGVGGDGIWGWSPIRLARESIGGGLVAERFGASFFKNNASGGAILEHPAQLSPEAYKRLTESVEKGWEGPDNAYKTKILEEGMKFARTSIPPEDAQFIETKQFSIEEIARLYRVPPHKIQHLLRSTFSNIEAQAIEYVVDTLQPWLVRWEQEVNRKVISGMARREGVFAEHKIAGLLRGDMKARAEFHTKMFMIGAASQNDILEMENKNGIGPKGDVYYVPTNMQPSRSEAEIKADKEAMQAQLEQPDDDAEMPPEDDAAEPDNDRALERITEAHVDLVEDALTRIAKIETDRIEARRKRPAFDEWLHQFRAQHAPHVRAAIGAPLDSAARSLWPILSDDGAPDMEAVMRFTEARAEAHCAGLPNGTDVRGEAESIIGSLVGTLKEQHDARSTA